MSLKKDASGRRSIQVEVEVPGTPEEVWRAIATGPGVTAWFVPTTFQEEAGKPVTLTSTFGPGMDSVAKVTEWNPPHRFAAESEVGGPGTPAMATEWIVEARAGGTCIVRVVHSLFASTDDWDNQLESVEQGWPGFFKILALYLKHYRGMPATGFQAMAIAQGSTADATRTLTEPLGLAAAKTGQKWKAPAGLPALGGRVEESVANGHQVSLLARLDTPTPGVALLGAFNCGGFNQVCLYLYLYGDQAEAAVSRDGGRWQQWLNELFPSAIPASEAG